MGCFDGVQFSSKPRLVVCWPFNLNFLIGRSLRLEKQHELGWYELLGIRYISWVMLRRSLDQQEQPPVKGVALASAAVQPCSGSNEENM